MLIRLIILCSSWICLFHSTDALSQTNFHSEQLLAQRQAYLEAKEALLDKRYSEYNRLRQQKLADYPLLPYLDFQELSRQLDQNPYQKIDAFLDKNNNSYLGNLLLRQWLSYLASHRRWHEYRSYFNTELKSAAHQCLFLWSRFQTGEPQALKEVAQLWNVGKSQPDECDPLFKAWQQAGFLTKEMVWDRYQKTLQRRNNNSLRRYLKRLMSPETRDLVKKYEQVVSNPSLLNNMRDYKSNHPYMSTLVYKGLRKYIRSDSDTAQRLWQKYQNIYTFSQQQKDSFNYALTKRYAFDDRPDKVRQQLSLLSTDQQITIIEIVLREQLRKRDWQSVYQWINTLPKTQQLSDRWQYWQARTYQALNRPKEQYLPVYQKLAETRSFYGFLSADFLSKPYNLQNAPSVVQQQTLQQLRETPALLRARELFFLSKFQDARQEWSYATAHLSSEEHQGVAQIAYEWGWHRKSIESMAAAAAWDDLSIRFPIAHKMIIQQQAQQANLPETLIFAIARQESAWESDARSSAGAMGLMQLMPRTAKETAKKAGIAHNKEDLFQPEHNITLGSRYISELLGKYNNNRVPAIAAYNAGPHRVNRWLKQSDRQLPSDVWIEVIPFGETRKYVQNVLSYAVVYSYHTEGKVSPLLTKSELSNL